MNRERPPAVDFLLKFWRCLESHAWPCLLAFSSLASPGSFLERELNFSSKVTLSSPWFSQET